METIANQLKQFRKEKNISQKELAHRSKISFVTINRIEGGSSPRISVITKIFEALGKKIDYVITDIQNEDLQVTEINSTL
jgi:transcriptional regulator with XRE-family HTH domain